MFVIYYTTDGRLASQAHYTYKKVAVRAAAKMDAYFASITVGGEYTPRLAVMDAVEYYATLGAQKRTVRNLMTGLPVEIDINTPLSCDPSSETYWSM
jgi:N-acetylmuramic acid 6-phosphate (MurNAc-6-P) etherase